MLFSSPAARLLCAPALLFLLGCYTTPYQYGYPPGYPMGPGGTVPPGGTVVPPGSTVPPPSDGNLGNPGKLQGNNGSKLGAPVPRQPTFEANNGKTPGTKKVPEYKDPNDIPPTAKKPAGGAAFDLKGDGGTAVPKKEDSSKPPVSPFGPGASNASPANGGVIPAAANQVSQEFGPKRFQPPKEVKPVPGATGTGAKQQVLPGSNPPTKAASPTPSPYDYDDKTYSWLRGKVDYDEVSKTWVIIYSLDPKDKYGGSFTLANDEKLKKLRNDDVFLVEGKIDSTAKDSRGKPIYRIDTLFGPLVPKGQVKSEAPNFPPNMQTSNTPRTPSF